MFGHLIQGLSTALLLGNLFYLVLGVTGGIVIGALPGLTATMGVAILLPFTFGMDAVTGLIMLVGIYIGAIYGGSISAILLNTPGTPASAATCFDGYALVKKGYPTKALSASTIASALGGLISCLALVTISPVLAKFALRFSAPEYFALALFGLTIIASISAENFLKGIIAGMIGLLISCFGMDAITSYPRFTFGVVDLLNGFSVIPVLIGLFAVSEVFNQIETLVGEKEIKTDIVMDKNYMNWQEIKHCLPTIIKSGVIGTFIGSIPGAGADIAAFVCYNEAKRSNKNEKFGEGSLVGISAPESGNNGVTGGALVPLLTLGVPGDAVAAVLLGALIIQGLTPGPLLFEQNPEIVYGLFSSMIIGNILLLFIGLAGIKFYSRIVEIPKTLMIPAILILSTIGSYSMNNSLFDVGVTFVFGIIGYIMSKIKMPSSPIVLAVILGPMLETNLRKAVLMYEGSYSFLYTRPITVVFLILTVLSMISALKKKK
ncbi:tripartite tricarboxylate transporter permease [Fusobacterium ulcerans]|uniref:tripartite tricarboxylate transporter permease n=1 Tax=Fusobacterium ulcerans TaxID=861 RepID=UPI001D0A93D1|nr:tripartite tricarboxylate transporter permease [Fusobacterium ulcerans]MCB8566271.1 tripartite tricarboxylate transporter permease [Fusobacterium ulcerans]MCB8650263.1 tripartite tricarboxylate transporter permease [Fusobacterium ulcerans]HJH06774.1 tripartite tricarboxylate transporter permease [Fusobacterium ulcerans]